MFEIGMRCRGVLCFFIVINVLCGLVKLDDVELFHVTDDNSESFDEDANITEGRNINGHNELAGGIVSIDCLRCLCLTMSDCRAIGCELRSALMGCGYFWLTKGKWIDCGSPGRNYDTCGNDLYCASKCMQRYMHRYATASQCPLNCEGFARVLGGGPNGCNDAHTLHFWNTVQQQPGCKGVE